MTLSKLKQEGREEFEKIFCLITAKRFWLMRTEDVSGVSGTGYVADGVIFPDGTVVLRWRTAGGSTAVYESIEQLEAIHGHEGRTKIEYLNEDEKIQAFQDAQIQKAYLSALSDVEKGLPKKYKTIKNKNGGYIEFVGSTDSTDTIYRYLFIKALSAVKEVISKLKETK